MPAPIILGTDLIDLRDGRPVVVSEHGPDGPTRVRKRRLGSRRWENIPFDPERFRRRPRRSYGAERYGAEVVRLATALGLSCREVFLMRED